MRTFLPSVLLILLFSLSIAQDYELTELDRYAYGPSSEILFLQQTAYMNSGANFLVLDVSEPTNVEVISSTSIGKIIRGFDMNDNILYSISHDSLYISEVFENGDVIIRNALPLTWGSVISCIEDFLIVVNTQKEFMIFDLNDPLEPFLLGSLEIPDKVFTMEYFDGYVITAHGKDYLGVISINDKSNPTWDTYTIAGNTYVASTCLVHDTLYVGANDSLLVYHMLQGPVFKKVGSAMIPGAPRRLDVSNGYAFLAGQGHKLQIYDVNDHSNIVYAASSDPRLDDVVVHQNIAYCFLQNAGIWIIDVSEPKSPQKLNELKYGERLFDMEKANDHLYFASGIEGIREVNLGESNHFSSSLTADYPSDYIQSLHIDYPYLYAGDANGKLWVHKISNDGSLEQVIFIETDNVKSLYRLNNLLFLCGTWPGGSITVFNVEDPENPKLESKLITQKPINSILLVGEYLYAHESQTNIKIIDFTDPANLVIVDSIDFPYSRTHNMVLYKDLLFLASGELVTLDVSDPLRPVNIENRINEWNIYRLAILDDLLFIAREEGLRIYDISNFSAPQIVESSQTFSGRDVLIEGAQVYLMDARAGFYWFELTEKTTSTKFIDDKGTVISLYPNPSEGNFHLDFEGMPGEFIKRIELISLDGRIQNLFQRPDDDRLKQAPYDFFLNNPLEGTHFLKVISNVNVYAEKLILTK